MSTKIVVCNVQDLFGKTRHEVRIKETGVVLYASKSEERTKRVAEMLQTLEEERHLKTLAEFVRYHTELLIVPDLQVLSDSTYDEIRFKVEDANREGQFSDGSKFKIIALVEPKHEDHSIFHAEIIHDSKSFYGRIRNRLTGNSGFYTPSFETRQEAIDGSIERIKLELKNREP